MSKQLSEQAPDASEEADSRRETGADTTTPIVEDTATKPADVVHDDTDTADAPDATATDTDAGDPEATTPGVRIRRLRAGTATRRVVAAVVVLALIAATACAVVFGLKWRHLEEVSTASSQARDTASAYAVTLTSVDPTKLDENFAAVLAGATGDFKKMYAQSSSQLRQVLLDNKATGRGTVVQAGVKSATTTRVEVLLFVDQSVTNSSSPQPRIDRSRILMTMVKVNGAWLADKVELP